MGRRIYCRRRVYSLDGMLMKLFRVIRFVREEFEVEAETVKEAKVRVVNPFSVDILAEEVYQIGYDDDKETV